MPPRSIAPPRLPARPRECHKGSFGRLLIAAGSVAAAREKGQVRVEGKDYVMQDGDVVNFRFNV